MNTIRLKIQDRAMPFPGQAPIPGAASIPTTNAASCGCGDATAGQKARATNDATSRYSPPVNPAAPAGWSVAQFLPPGSYKLQPDEGGTVLVLRKDDAMTNDGSRMVSVSDIAKRHSDFWTKPRG